MTDDIRPDEFPDFDPWLIPLHGASPITSADAGETPPVLGVAGPGAELVDSSQVLPTSDSSPGPALPFPPDDDVPTEGFHPRLRRSA
jgi:hypothetical protein